MKRLFIIPMIVVMLLLCDGCSQDREQYTRLIVQSMAIDKTDEGNYRLTMLAFKADGSQGMLSNGTEGGDIERITSEGESVYEAIRNVNEVTGLTPFYAHNNGIILGEGLVRAGVEPVLETFSLYTEMRPSTHIFTCKGLASELIADPESDDTGSARQLYLLAESGKKNGRIVSINIKEAVALEARHYSDIYIPVLVMGENGLAVNGTAVFCDGKLSGYFDADETRGLMFILNRMQDGVAVLENNEEKVTFNLSRCESNISAKMQSGIPQFNITVNMWAEPHGGKENERFRYGMAAMNDAQKCVEEYVKECIVQVISKGLSYKSDVFSFGQRLYMNYPNQFSSMSEDWRDMLQNGSYIINVNVNMRESRGIRDAY